MPEKKPLIPKIESVIMKTLLLFSLLLFGCNQNAVTPEEVPDKMRTYVQDITGGSNYLKSRAWFYEWETNPQGKITYINATVEPVSFLTPQYVMDDLHNQFNYCFEFDVWMKSRKTSELREVDMSVCDKAIKEKRESAIGFNAWVRRVVWEIY